MAFMRKKSGWGCSLLVDCLSTMHKTLVIISPPMHTLGMLVNASNPSTWEMGRQEEHKFKVVFS